MLPPHTLPPYIHVFSRAYINADAPSQVSETWLNHPDNPNKGKPRKPRAPKKKKADDAERPEREPATDASSLPPSSPVTSSP